jgi:hypothetical protein
MDLASFRVKVEHKFRELKIFRILSGTYRNFRKKLHMRLNIIAGIVNLEHAFLSSEYKVLSHYCPVPPPTC